MPESQVEGLLPWPWRWLSPAAMLGFTPQEESEYAEQCRENCKIPCTVVAVTWTIVFTMDFAVHKRHLPIGAEDDFVEEFIVLQHASLLLFAVIISCLGLFDGTVKCDLPGAGKVPFEYLQMLYSSYMIVLDLGGVCSFSRMTDGAALDMVKFGDASVIRFLGVVCCLGVVPVRLHVSFSQMSLFFAISLAWRLVIPNVCPLSPFELVTLLVLSVGVVFINGTREYSQRKAWKLQRQTGVMRNEAINDRDAFSAMLGRHVDAVVRLSSTGTLLETSRPLGTMMLKDEGIPRGESFYQFLADGYEKVRFENGLFRTTEQSRSSCDKPSDVRVFSVRLKDSTCRSFAASLCSCQLLGEGPRQYFLGITVQEERWPVEQGMKMTKFSRPAVEKSRAAKEPKLARVQEPSPHVTPAVEDVPESRPSAAQSDVTGLHGPGSSPPPQVGQSTSLPKLRASGLGAEIQAPSSSSIPQTDLNMRPFTAWGSGADFETGLPPSNPGVRNLAVQLLATNLDTMTSDREPFERVFGMAPERATLDQCWANAAVFKSWLEGLVKEVQSGALSPPLSREFGECRLAQPRDAFPDTARLTVWFPDAAECGVREIRQLISQNAYVVRMQCSFEAADASNRKLAL